MSIQLESSWLALLKDEFEKDYMKSLKEFLKEEKKNRQMIYPKGSDIFKAFELTPFQNVKVVILGQDPYHGAHQAHGLSFSVQKGVKQPPSLQNIFKELANDIPDFEIPNHGDLTDWAKQGVLLLNVTLTVSAGKAGSHQNKGWESFTDKVIEILSEQREGLIFILWGRFAQAKENLINQEKHYIIKSAHPSPFSAYSGFFGSKPFSKTNEILRKLNKTEINWQI
ncbi:MAG: uracil-DNA glycosylase [Sphingobacteriales bacterium]|nr:uracil-DNA glycosylase [Sphingobacteriales bacterium]